MTEKLTLEERLARAARSQAASPEVAAGLVRKLSQFNIIDLFRRGDDIDLISEMIGPYIDQIDGNVLYYSGFCRAFQLALTHAASQAEPDAHARLVLETRIQNAVVLLGLMLLDHAKGRERDRGRRAAKASQPMIRYTPAESQRGALIQKRERQQEAIAMAQMIPKMVQPQAPCSRRAVRQMGV